MKRQRWFEIHDSPWFPRYFRDLVTEALQSVWNRNHTYRPIAGRFRAALRRSGTRTVVDLCSGSGGPWIGLLGDVAAGEPLTLALTDRYPSAALPLQAAELRATGGGNAVTAWAEPVDARSVPPRLRGFRTIFSSFHHFDPGEAQAILADAFARREGIAVFEAACRNAKTMTLLVGVPLLSLRASASARPLRWDRLLFTWLIPVVPAVLLIDGLLSCLRSYSLDDLGELTAGLQAPGYEWQLGEEQTGTVPIRYLIGIPARPAAIEAFDRRDAVGAR